MLALRGVSLKLLSIVQRKSEDGIDREASAHLMRWLVKFFSYRSEEKSDLENVLVVLNTHFVYFYS